MSPVLRVDVNPNPGDLPGGAVIQQLMDGLAGWALFGSLAALLISAIVWALGANSGNYHAAGRGKTGLGSDRAAGRRGAGADQLLQPARAEGLSRAPRCCGPSATG